MYGIWPLPSGRRRPSIRIGFPWFGGFCAWVGVGRLAVDHVALRRPGLESWLAWVLVGVVLVPASVAVVSRLVGVLLSGRALLLAACASGVAAAVARIVLFADFGAFAFVGGFFVSLAATAAYAFATARGEEAWRDANLR